METVEQKEVKKYSCRKATPIFEDNGHGLRLLAGVKDECGFETDSKDEAIVHAQQTGHKVAEMEIIHYCECGQGVRLRKKDNTWVHYGYKRMHEPYSVFLERTNHPVKITSQQRWIKKYLEVDQQ